MATRINIGRSIPGLVLFCLALASQQAFAHGGVVEEEDLCVIKVNYLRGHFKIYQPRVDGHKEYCEDLPNAAETVFVMEYLHDELGRVPVDFRIIRDVTGKGRFARWEDVAAIDDLDSVTVFHQGPAIEPDVFTAVHHFEAEGDFIGIVTAGAQGGDKTYRAVFPFEVGFTGFGYWPLIVGVLILIQFQYLVMSGRIKRWRAVRRKPGLEVVSVLLLLALPVAASELWTVEFESSVQPIPVNTMHSWELLIRTTAGQPVTNAEITVEGGMPAHDHGLPTRPRVTEELGGGRYRLDGLRFHMAGQWEISVTIKADGKTETVIIPLQL